MTYYIERDFPIEQLNPLAQRETNAKRAIAMLHKWWARRVGCVFRIMILASLIPEEEWRRLDEEVSFCQAGRAPTPGSPAAWEPPLLGEISFIA